MNLYFWLFFVYSVLIIPVGAQVHVRFENGIYYRVNMTAAGMPVYTGKEKRRGDMRRAEPSKHSRSWDTGLVRELMKQGHFQRLIHLFEWHDVQLRVRISFADAARTAMTYAVIRSFLLTLACVRPLPLKGGVEMDFQGKGSMISFRCIAQARLGILLAETVRLWLAVSRHKAARMKMEEEQYAAASH